MAVHVARLHFHGMYARSVLQAPIHFHFWAPLPFVPTEPWHELAHLGSLGALAVCVMVGVGSRPCAALFALLYAAFVLSERSMFNNHYYLHAQPVDSGACPLCQQRPVTRMAGCLEA